MICKFSSPNMEPDCSVLSKMFTCGKYIMNLKKDYTSVISFNVAAIGFYNDF